MGLRGYEKIDFSHWKRLFRLRNYNTNIEWGYGEKTLQKIVSKCILYHFYGTSFCLSFLKQHSLKKTNSISFSKSIHLFQFCRRIFAHFLFENRICQILTNSRVAFETRKLRFADFFTFFSHFLKLFRNKLPSKSIFPDFAKLVSCTSRVKVAIRCVSVAFELRLLPESCVLYI